MQLQDGAVWDCGAAGEDHPGGVQAGRVQVWPWPRLPGSSAAPHHRGQGLALKIIYPLSEHVWSKKKTWLNTTSHCWLDTDMFFLFKCNFFCFTVYAVRYVTEYRYWINCTFYPRRVKQTYLFPTCFTFRLSYTVPYIWSDIQQTCPVYPAGYWKIADYSIWPDIFFCILRRFKQKFNWHFVKNKLFLV